jgi:hypothetical protein
MNACQIRAELLEQHRNIRSEIAVVRSVAELAREGAPVREELAAAVALLASAVQHHNAREEELLGLLLRKVDAWGWARTEIMTGEHASEHAEIHAALLGVPTTIDEFAGSAVAVVLDRLVEHMSREEKAFLNEETLRDDEVAVDAVDG